VTRLIVVSNRVALPRDRSARAGGLAVGVLSALKRSGGMWFGWSGETNESPAPQPKVMKSGGITYATIDFTAEEFDAYYNGYCNSTLWPLLHYRLGLVEHSRQHQDAYMRINAASAWSSIRASTRTPICASMRASPTSSRRWCGRATSSGSMTTS
jgi:trehalose 6-phosphate synthase